MYKDNFSIVIPVDNLLHTPDKPFCNQTLYPDCPCREDQSNIQEVSGYVVAGLLTPDEATRTIQGHQL